MGVDVYSIEEQHRLYRYSMRQLSSWAITQKLVFGDGYNGLPAFAHNFRSILVTAGAVEIPNALLDQLAISGRMVIPVGWIPKR